jgi:hypothetical protein
MKHAIETAHYPATQAVDQPFQATLREGWGVWLSFMREDFLKATFTRRTDADAFAAKHTHGGQRGQVRRMWLLVNEMTGEAYELASDGTQPLQGVDLDFRHHQRLKTLRSDVLSRLSDAELHVLGLKRS